MKAKMLAENVWRLALRNGYLAAAAAAKYAKLISVISGESGCRKSSSSSKLWRHLVNGGIIGAQRKASMATWRKLTKAKQHHRAAPPA
jgi:hypothetical protein